ncbi:hypothetical protein TI01_1076 [Lysobacter sp. A03]|nr:hypothetical protein TI01_1076 [Lysobacter sp. A03]
MAYDGDVYSLPLANGWIDVKSDNDVRMLNEQQLLTATANVYFREASEATSVSREYGEATARRLPSKHRINHAVLDWDDGVTKRFRVTTADEARGQDALIHSEKMYPRPSGWPNFIRIRAGAAAYSNGTGVGYVRRAHADSTWSKPFRKIRLDAIKF